MKFFGTILLLLGLSTVSYAETWTCNITCDVVTSSTRWLSATGSTYAEAQDRLVKSCIGENVFLHDENCGEVGTNSYKCSGGCTDRKSYRRYISGTGNDQYQAGNRAISNCQALGEVSYYSVGPCSPR